jgi:hypothetical protein
MQHKKYVHLLLEVRSTSELNNNDISNIFDDMQISLDTLSEDYLCDEAKDVELYIDSWSVVNDPKETDK